MTEPSTELQVELAPRGDDDPEKLRQLQAILHRIAADQGIELDVRDFSSATEEYPTVPNEEVAERLRAVTNAALDDRHRSIRYRRRKDEETITDGKKIVTRTSASTELDMDLPSIQPLIDAVVAFKDICADGWWKAVGLFFGIVAGATITAQSPAGKAEDDTEDAEDEDRP